MEARPDRGHEPAIVDGNGDAVTAGFERRLQGPDDVEIGVKVFESPLGPEACEEAGEIAARRLEGRPFDLDLEEPDDRIDDEIADRHALPDDLAMDLALGRDVDEEVAVDHRPAAEPAIGGEASKAVVLRLVRTRRGQVRTAGGDPVLGELPLSRPDLAAAAESAPAADRIKIDAE